MLLLHEVRLLPDARGQAIGEAAIRKLLPLFGPCEHRHLLDQLPSLCYTQKLRHARYEKVVAKAAKMAAAIVAILRPSQCGPGSKIARDGLSGS